MPKTLGGAQKSQRVAAVVANAQNRPQIMVDNYLTAILTVDSRFSILSTTSTLRFWWSGLTDKKREVALIAMVARFTLALNPRSGVTKTHIFVELMDNYC